jgi:site-specific recombinase XerD
MVTAENEATGQCASREAPAAVRKVVLTHSPNGIKFNQPIEFELPVNMSEGDRDVYNYIIRSLAGFTPKQIPFACGQLSIFELAKYLKLGFSFSEYTLRGYTNAIYKFSRWLGRQPDELIAEAKAESTKLAEHSKILGNFAGELQARGLAPNSISDYTKALKTLYRANGLRLELFYPLRTGIRYEDHPPTPEDLQRLIDIGDLREKVIVSWPPLSGFRLGTFAALCYRHVKHDLERGIIPLHIHVEAEITKGKYRSYDTFVGKEAVDYMKAYLDMRRRGSLRKIRYKGGCTTHVGFPPEEITDESPLIRNAHDVKPKPLKPGEISRIIHNLYLKAGLIGPGNKRRHELTAHSLRKYFKTQMTALRVQDDYVEYMMGHTISTYDKVKSLGIEFLRNVYASSGLSIRPKTGVARLEMLRQMVSAWGMDPDKVLVKEAFAEPHRVFVLPQDREEDQVKILSRALKEAMRKELLDEERVKFDTK